MILIKLSEDNYEYDVHSLVRAFYHGQQVIVRKSLQDADFEVDHQASVVIVVDYQPEQIVIAFYERKVQKEYGLEIRGRVLTMQDEIKVDYSNRPETKNRLKKLLYQLLCRRLQRELPWGTLTGIRPIKIPMNMLEEGREEPEIRRYMRDTYRISEKKIDLSLELARRELSILNTFDYQNGYSLYIGIPFCPSTCAYCSFTSYPLGRYRDKVDDYLKALRKELFYISGKLSHKVLDTIYIGGGTPTTLEPRQLEFLFQTIEEFFDVSMLQEFSIEAGRPDSITREKLEVIRRHGVTRISINPQTLHQKTLDLIGRHHTVEQFEEAYALAQEEGFDNINTDVILGLPDETFEDVQKTFERIFQLDPQSITVHSLALKRAARLTTGKEQYAGCHFENDPEMMEWVIDQCRQHGYHPYYLYRQKNMINNLENIGFSKPGKEGYYNILIMEERQTIVGTGAGSITKFVFYTDEKIQKVDNVKDVDLYIDRIDQMIERKDHFIQSHFSRDKDELAIMEELPRQIAHGMNVSNLAYAIAREYGLSQEQCYELAQAGMIHDIGKLLLFQYLNGNDTGDLGIEQIKYIRLHSTISYEVLRDHGYSDFVLESVYYHHECYDGSGFPEHLRGEEIPIGARILRVCDVFTALTSTRAYRGAFDPVTAASLMIDESKNFDIRVFLAFMRVIHEIDLNKITINAIGREYKGEGKDATE